MLCAARLLVSGADMHLQGYKGESAATICNFVPEVEKVRLLMERYVESPFGQRHGLPSRHSRCNTISIAVMVKAFELVLRLRLGTQCGWKTYWLNLEEIEMIHNSCQNGGRGRIGKGNRRMFTLETTSFLASDIQ